MTFDDKLALACCAILDDIRRGVVGSTAAGNPRAFLLLLAPFVDLGAVRSGLDGPGVRSLMVKGSRVARGGGAGVAGMSSAPLRKESSSSLLRR